MAKLCSVIGCNNKARTRGFCGKHYMRFYRHGSPFFLSQHRRVGSINLSKEYFNEYRSWLSMRNRCLNKKHAQYKDYGGRGINICDRWLNKGGFKHFLEDMGKRPDGMTLDRINNDCGYSPENCRWATRKEQSRNRRSNTLHRITINGETHCISEWAEIMNIPVGCIFDRLTYGWDEKSAVMKPKR